MLILYNGLWWVLLYAAVVAQDIAYPDTDCSDSQYYNNIALVCTSLPAGYKESSGTFSCDSQYKRTTAAGNIEFTCNSCTDLNTEMSSFFGDKCTTCPTGKPITSDKRCSCDYSTEILVDVELNGAVRSPAQCVLCDKEQGLEPGERDEHGIPRRCVQCVNSDCKCEYQAGFCFPEMFFRKSVSEIVQYNEDTNFKSKLLADNLLGVYGLCNANVAEKRNNVTACQMLTNICTLLLSDKTSLIGDTACKLLWEITQHYETSVSAATLLYGRPGWVERVPWLFYDFTLKEAYRFRTNEDVLTETFDQKFTFEKGLNTSMLQLEVVSYSLTGQDTPMKPLTTELSLCTGTPFTGFGTAFSAKCDVDLDTLRTYTTQLHELYLKVGDNVYPVPVLVENSNSEVLKEQDKWVLTRRFFLVDNQLGIRDSDDTLYVVRYASKISLSVTVLDDEYKHGQIYMPLLRVLYGEVKNDAHLVKEVHTEFEITYSMSGDNLTEPLGIACGVMSFLGLVYAVIRTISYRRRNHIVDECSCQTMCSFFLFLCQGVGMYLFWVLLGTSWYYLCIYKGQKAVSVFLPQDQDPILSVLISAFVLTMLSRFYLLHRTTTYDIFFVDWEKPKGKFIPTSTSTKEKETLTSVSIWRTYFLSNEWNELHTIRKINPTLQYIVFIFLTEYVGCKYLTTHQPLVYINPLSVDYISDYSPVLRIGLIFAVFFLLWVLQRFYNFLYERFVSDQLQMYIDLCSISNVSVFVLCDAVYGYYIHGRSVHGHADADMREIVSALKREEDNLCSKRGLTPDSDQQTFDMVVPYLLRSHYNRITQTVNSRDISQRQNQGSDVEKQIVAYSHINRLFSSFIDRSLDDIDYTVGDKLFLEHFLDMEIREPSPGKGILYDDHGQSFENVLYYGNEWLLFTWEILLVALLDYIVTHFTAACIIAWFINEVLLNKLSAWKCQRNVAAKALIDNRFLL